MDHIRNFSIIAHIDHGKSTLADRLIERCGGLAKREMQAQVLDSMEIEKERGITIKAQTAALRYEARDGQVYNLNLIDTPGHVDFSYEVSRSLSACEGALLVVDASQGVEAQTVANCYTALDLGVEVLPVLNKMDLPNADPDTARAEIEDVIGIDASQAIECSAKTGMGIDDILEAIVARVPPPRGRPGGPLRAMIIDSWFDSYVGVVMLVRVVDGRLARGERIKLMATDASYEANQLGVFTPRDPVGLDPSRGDRGGGAMTADRQQVPDSKESAGQKHEAEAGTDVGDQQARETGFARPRDLENLARRKWPPGPALDACCQRRHSRGPSVRLFHLDRARKEGVVLEVNVLVQVRLENRKRLVERLVTDAGVGRRGVCGAGLAHRLQGVAGRVVLVQHHRHRVLHTAEGRRQHRFLLDDRLFHAHDVG